MLKEKSIAIIGVGKLGEALILGLLKNSDLDNLSLEGTVAKPESLQRVKDRLQIKVGLDNTACVKEKDIVILAVKPQNMDKVLGQIRPYINDQLVISVAASVSTSFLEERLSPGARVIRAMPNTPSVINCGMTGLCSGSQATPEDIALTEAIFRCVGETVFVDESLMDAVTALSASGPAYLYVVIESLAEAGVKLGIPRDVSTLLAAQTMLGASSMVLETKAHPALLKDTVTTPAGCTIDGLMELEEGKLRVTLIKAVVKAAQRAKELVQKNQS